MYNFKKEVKVYMYSSGTLYPIDVYPDISFSQTIKEGEYGKKTLHNPLALYKGATVTSYNPANFSFTVPVRNTSDLTVLNSLMTTDYSTGNIKSNDIYIQLSNTFYRLSTAVFENIVFNIENTAVVTISISGTAAKLDQVSSLPTTPQAKSSDPYTLVRGIDVSVGGVSLESVASLHIEVDNTIKWLPNNTVYNAVNNTNVWSTQYVLSERRISGSITQFLTNNNKNLGSDFSTTQAIVLKVYSNVNSSPYLVFTLPETVYSRRLDINDLITRIYDFRLTSSNIALIPNTN